MEGDLSQAEVCSLRFQDVSRTPWEKTTLPGCVPLYLKITKISFFFPLSQSSLHRHSMHEPSPGNGSRCLPAQKTLTWAKVPYKEKVFPFWATHTFSLGSSYKGKRPKHVLHTNRSYIHRQSRVQEWHSFICLWLIINQSFTFFFALTSDYHTLVLPCFFPI